MLLRIEDIVTIKEDILAIHQIMTGMFDKEIATLTQLRDEIKLLASKADTVKKAEAVKKAADDYAIKIKAEVDTYYAGAEKFESHLKEREIAVGAKETLLEERDTELVTKTNAFQEIVSSTNRQMMAKKKELDELADKLDHQRIELSTWEESIRQQDKLIQDKLAILKGM